MKFEVKGFGEERRVMIVERGRDEVSGLNVNGEGREIGVEKKKGKMFIEEGGKE